MSNRIVQITAVEGPGLFALTAKGEIYRLTFKGGKVDSVEIVFPDPATGECGGCQPDA